MIGALTATTASAALYVTLIDDWRTAGSTHKEASQVEQKPAAFGVLADPSDPIPEYQYNNFLMLLTKDLPTQFSRRDRIVVFKQLDNFSNPVTVTMDTSSPGRDDEYDIFTENLGLAGREYEKFIGEFHKTITQSLAPSPQDFSPICEAILAASRHRAFLDADQKVLIVLSDLLEHAPPYSVYSQGGLRALPPRCNGTLNGLTVVFLIIERGHPKQEEAKRLFEDWILTQGGRVAARL